MCNDVLYSLLHAYHGTETLAGFIHVPFLPEQMKGRSTGYAMELDDMVKGIQAVLEKLNRV